MLSCKCLAFSFSLSDGSGVGGECRSYSDNGLRYHHHRHVSVMQDVVTNTS